MIQFIAEKSRMPYIGNSVPGGEGWGASVAMRVMSDHIRAISFCTVGSVSGKLFCDIG
jgi:hypothetical protein